MISMSETESFENAILVDADHVDKVAFNLIVNFERMIGRRIPQADMARWLDCVALDGGVREKPQADGQDSNGQSTHVVLIHDKGRACLENFVPGRYADELDGKAFRDHLGEFAISALPVESLTTKDDFFIEALQALCAQQSVKRIMVIAADELYGRVRDTLRRIDDDDKRITVFTMEPREGGNFRQEILGYSLMAALGIRGDEIKES